MLATVLSATPYGVDAHRVCVEVHVQGGLPQMQIVGLPDTAVRESRDRVRSAIRNCGFGLPSRNTVINLAPADLRKEGSFLDLAIALALLCAHEKIAVDDLDGIMACGELGLDGSIRPIRGALAIGDLAAAQKVRQVLLPVRNAEQASCIADCPAIGVSSLDEAIRHLVGLARLEASEPRSADSSALEGPWDLAEVRGQESGKRALEIGAAGGHNLLFVGPPGTGKTMLARCLPTLLPPLAGSEAIEVSKIHSLYGEWDCGSLLRERPFRSPHSGISAPGMVGGGTNPRPGEVSLAHGGVLFLDELPQFRRDVLETLRQPLEDGCVSVVRAKAAFTFPARFSLLAAMNPCPCGFLGDDRRACRCPVGMVEQYRRRLSGPLLDRIDLHVEVPAPSLAELQGPRGEPGAVVADRVRVARRLQAKRSASMFGDQVSNGELSSRQLSEVAALGPGARRLLADAYEHYALSARAVHRIQRVARTIADLERQSAIRSPHLAEAIQLRALDRGHRPAGR